MNLSDLWILVPPVTGGIIGYFTNDIAIKMLFRPYRAIYIGGQPLPFTPGLIPRNQARLAKRVADTVMKSLLTPGELQNLARRLLQTERVQSAIQWLLQLALDQIKLDAEQKTAKILAGVLRDGLGQSLPRLLKVLARRENFLEPQLNQIFDQVLLELQLSDEQANKLADWFLQSVLPPDTLRQAIVNFLSDRNIQIIDEGFREKTSGTYWVVANLFGARNALTRLRTFCLEEKEASNVRLAELIVSLNIKQRLAEWLQELSLQNLPVSTVRQLRQNFRESVRNYVQLKGASLIQGLSSSLDWDDIAGLLLNRLRSSSGLSTSLEVISQELALILERYLEKDLELIVMQAIPILDLDQVIIDRVKSTSPEELEVAIQGIVKSELQGIVNLGGILGLVIGMLQSVLLLIR
ncbi:Alr5253 protein [uncultured Synechococcales cyanobacterium]|uniref:Alr5253 protein n=1 Tax=uncultured Synechococcales cyanobacterium TaxID=1936017 RepID=A0A6J4VMN6_9CYAN|nr:Alr5253 protein [uncultured Synechococcales cyanobacterium]